MTRKGPDELRNMALVIKTVMKDDVLAALKSDIWKEE